MPMEPKMVLSVDGIPDSQRVFVWQKSEKSTYVEHFRNFGFFPIGIIGIRQFGTKIKFGDPVYPVDVFPLR